MFMSRFHSAATIESMSRYRIGVLGEQWHNITPPIQKSVMHEESQPVEPEVAALAQSTARSYRDDSKHSSSNMISRRIREDTPESDAGSEVSSIFEKDTLDSGATSQTSQDDISDRDLHHTNQEVTKFREMVSKVEAEGLYDSSVRAWMPELIRWSFLIAGMLYFLRHGWYCTSAAFMGMFWHSLAGAAHDAAHMGVTHDWNVDTIIATGVMNCCSGISSGWWKSVHNVHHVVTNSLHHDQDVQSLPFIAVSPKLFQNLFSTYHNDIVRYTKFAEFMVIRQAHTYYVVLCFARFVLYLASWTFVIDKLRNTKTQRFYRICELLGLCTFATWYGYFIVYRCIPTATSRFLFVLISHAITMPLHLQLTLSHFAMSTEEGEAHESWAAKALRTTMDVDCPEWMDWFHNGLQHQVPHHLFPRMPRHNLRKAAVLVRQYCQDTGLKYECLGFEESKTATMRSLGEVARQARYLKDCHDDIVKKGEYLHGHWE